MIGESSETATLSPPEAKASVLITVTTPGIETAICRLGNSEDVVRGLTVRELIQRVISPNSLFSVGVPISQLQAESAAALAIGELLGADCCEVVLPAKGSAQEEGVPLDQLARGIAREHVGTQGNRFLNITLEVRSSADAVAPTGGDRRQVSAPPTVEVESMAAVRTPSSAPAQTPEWHRAIGWETELDDDTLPAEAVGAVPAADDVELALAALEPGSSTVGAVAEGSADVQATSALEQPLASPPQTAASGILTIVAESAPQEAGGGVPERKQYVRKADWLRAQFMPEVEALDFSGLFVGNLGLGIREEKTRRNVVLADPARITEVLLRANGYRRSGEHAKALICYQELVDMDAGNADFRFLLGKTLLALGQKEEASEALLRAKELGHEGADKELTELKRTGHRPRAGFGFLRFWKS